MTFPVGHGNKSRQSSTALTAQPGGEKFTIYFELQAAYRTNPHRGLAVGVVAAKDFLIRDNHMHGYVMAFNGK